MTLRSLIANSVYRVRQFTLALTGRVTPRDMAEARSVLGPDLFPLFAAMPGQYRHHMLAVYRRVRKGGCQDRAAWQAALLHDVGKYDPASGRSVTIPYRVALVLLHAVGPGRRLLARLTDPGPGAPKVGAHLAGRMGWRYPFYLLHEHTRLGAALVERYGGSQSVVRLVADHHKEAGEDELLAALQAADSSS